MSETSYINKWFEAVINEMAESQCVHETVTENTSKDNRSIKSNFEIKPLFQGMYLYAYAFGASEYESTLHISCAKGKAISYGCYDIANDAYIVHGVDSINLGSIPVNFKLYAKDSGSFLIDIPLPEIVLKRYMTKKQKSLLQSFQTKYKKKYKINFLQVLKVY